MARTKVFLQASRQRVWLGLEPRSGRTGLTSRSSRRNCLRHHPSDDQGPKVGDSNAVAHLVVRHIGTRRSSAGLADAAPSLRLTSAESCTTVPSGSTLQAEPVDLQRPVFLIYIPPLTGTGMASAALWALDLIWRRLAWSINDTAVLGTTRTWPIRAGRARLPAS